MKQIILTLFVLIGTSADTGLFAQLGDYWMFGQRFDGYSIAIDSDSQCVKYDGVDTMECSLRDWSMILSSKDLII